MQRLVFMVVLAVSASPAMAQTGAYAGQQSRDIAALSAAETADLLAGRGMGLARAAELNHYPGPMHALELRDRLGLTPGQVGAVQASFDRMAAAAKALGADLVQRERALDDLFKSGSVTPGGMSAETAAIGGLQGQLRAVHLSAHLNMRNILTPAQVAAYDKLRGYADGGSPPAGGHGRQAHPG